MAHFGPESHGVAAEDWRAIYHCDEGYQGDEAQESSIISAFLLPCIQWCHKRIQPEQYE